MARLISPEPSDLAIRTTAIELALRWDNDVIQLDNLIGRAATIEDYLRNGKAAK